MHVPSFGHVTFTVVVTLTSHPSSRPCPGGYELCEGIEVDERVVIYFRLHLHHITTSTEVLL